MEDERSRYPVVNLLFLLALNSLTKPILTVGDIGITIIESVGGVRNIIPDQYRSHPSWDQASNRDRPYFSRDR